MQSPFHIGEPGVGLEASGEHIPSDTLFSALCHAWSLLWGQDSLEALLEEFAGTVPVPFRISSAFPYMGDSLFLPRPYSKAREFTRLSTDQAKKIKNVKYLSQGLFETWITGNLFGRNEFDQLAQEQEILSDAILRAQVARNRVDRATAHTDLYFCETVSLATDAGLYAFVDVQERHAETLRTTLAFLGEEMGIGGERKLGLGRFVCEWDTLSLTEPDAPTHYLTLSPYYPKGEEQAEIAELIHAYDLVLCSGFSGSAAFDGQVKRCACRMFKEGSVFTKEITGQLVPVQPERLNLPHAIYRSGLAYSVGVHIAA